VPESSRTLSGNFPDSHILTRFRLPGGGNLEILYFIRGLDSPEGYVFAVQGDLHKVSIPPEWPVLPAVPAFTAAIAPCDEETVDRINRINSMERRLTHRIFTEIHQSMSVRPLRPSQNRVFAAASVKDRNRSGKMPRYIVMITSTMLRHRVQKSSRRAGYSFTGFSR